MKLYRTGIMPTCITALLFIFSFPPPMIAQTSIHEQEVSFSNGPVHLAGTLIMPGEQGTYPAVVFIHGSGPMTRAGFRPYAEAFAELGVASLFFDKRGTGSSGGSWTRSSLFDLAEDALAAVNYLKKHEHIDPDRIGFWGISQAGWIAPLAASRSDDIAFMIVISGGGANPRESELYSFQKEFEKAGLTETEETKAVKILNTYYNYLETGEGRSLLIATLDSIRKSQLKPLAEHLSGLLPSEENRSNWSWVGGYNAISDIKNVKCPVLLLFGARDTDHPTDLAVKRWRKGLNSAGNDDVTIMVFPGAGHGIRMRESHNGNGRAPFADGYREIQLGWLWLHVIQQK